jgi:hypothetical protein
LRGNSGSSWLSQPTTPFSKLLTGTVCGGSFSFLEVAILERTRVMPVVVRVSLGSRGSVFLVLREPRDCSCQYIS